MTLNGKCYWLYGGNIILLLKRKRITFWKVWVVWCWGDSKNSKFYLVDFTSLTNGVYNRVYSLRSCFCFLSRIIAVYWSIFWRTNLNAFVVKIFLKSNLSNVFFTVCSVSLSFLLFFGFADIADSFRFIFATRELKTSLFQMILFLP